MKSIRSKIILSMTLTILVSLIAVGVSGIYLNYSSTADTLDHVMTEMSYMAAERVEQELKVCKSVASDAGLLGVLADPEITVAEKQQLVNQRVSAHGFERGNLLGVNGVSLFDGNDYSDREYFQKSIKGETVVSDPLVSQLTGQVTIIVSAPLWENGVPNSKVVGVVYFVPKETFLNDIVSSVKVSSNGSAYILNKNGTTIAHPNAENVKNMENTQQDAITDPSLARLAELEKQMTAGTNGFGTYSYGGVDKYLAFAPIGGTDGWSIGINAPTSDFLASTIAGIVVTAAITVCALLVAIIIAFILGKRIGDPLKASAQCLSAFTQGNFNTTVPTVRSEDEIGVLTQSLRQMADSLKIIMSDMIHEMNQFADGNFSTDTQVEQSYVGDYLPLLVSQRKLRDTLSDTLSRVKVSAEQVALGSNQVSSAAQQLATGATQQAATVEELSASAQEIAQQAEENLTTLQTAGGFIGQASAGVDASTRHMEELTHAMKNISDSSGQIVSITKVIEDIAFQTNILALNASVEAARAGTSGRGFAIVADEVRNLAAKSADAARQTSELIASTVNAVSQGTKMTEKTAQALQDTGTNAAKVNESFAKIEVASNAQTIAMEQIREGVSQISAVVQTNAATAEENSSASEEMSAQARMLRHEIEKFKFMDRNDNQPLSPLVDMQPEAGFSISDDMMAGKY